MLETTIGPVRFAVSSDCLVVEDANQSQHPLSLALNHLPGLIAFLQSINPYQRTRAFRVEVDKDAGLQALIQHESTSVAATVQDISLVGISVRISPEPDFSIDAPVTVSLKLNDRRATLPAIVRRHTGMVFGIEFTDCFQDNSLSPPEELRQIVAPLEIRWLRANRER
jgi:hypothetical protein